jgi:hypothetical protein
MAAAQRRIRLRMPEGSAALTPVEEAAVVAVAAGTTDIANPKIFGV